ncbi:hypothetical protein M011DRAFT_330474 [Sporormia fimetaria CBS 119925]|uniref:Uncharacterized protein n=1 Tax=Sporormia fimetaria CBS 119925 TaxID=1340428 RepID=A0A6A6VGB9_9PLEO|nr:hypothetical protein M011DRAFT_330474 [Sporormia fimetaria CBS 119925]
MIADIATEHFTCASRTPIRAPLVRVRRLSPNWDDDVWQTEPGARRLSCSSTSHLVLGAGKLVADPGPSANTDGWCRCTPRRHCEMPLRPTPPKRPTAARCGSFFHQHVPLSPTPPLASPIIDPPHHRAFEPPSALPTDHEFHHLYASLILKS